MNWYYNSIAKKYASFTGRARRKEYWYFFLFNVIFSFVLGCIDGVMGTFNAAGIGLMTGIYFLATLIPSIAVSVRRLHDIDCSGWWLLVSLIPIFGAALLVPMVLRGTSGENAYGSDPRSA